MCPCTPTTVALAPVASDLQGVDAPAPGSLDNTNGIQKEDWVPSTSMLTSHEKIEADNPDLVASLNMPQKNVPVRFLYDHKGSDLYELITQLDEYYPYNEEKALLQSHTSEILSNVPSSAVIVELGCGDGSKTAVLLDALAARDGADNVRFLGIDVSGGALLQARRNLQTLCPSIPAANLELCEAEYLPGLAEARRRHPEATLCVLWLGSSVGNFNSDETVSFLNSLRCAVGDNAALLLCTDLWKDAAILHAAYDDSKGVTREFIINGMCHALRTLGHSAAERPEVWQYEAVINAEHKQVEMWVEAQEEIQEILPGVAIGKGERVLMEISRKFTPQGIAALAQRSGLCVEATWASAKYSIQLLVPVPEALRRCWQDTDALFSHISNWMAQPIGLRHPFIFYYGHVAAFTKLKVLPSAEPSETDETFSRGMDPNVLDPSQCHAHPEAPHEWPTKEKLEHYVAGVRRDVLSATTGKCMVAAMGAGGASINADALPDMHAVAMAVEHERMHQETLCYMMAQQRKHDWEAGNAGAVIISPSGIAANGTSCSNNSGNAIKPVYFANCSYAASAQEPSPSGSTKASTVTIPRGTVCLGMDLSSPSGFVWDNELGTRGPVEVESFSVSSHPVTVGEFLNFVHQHKGYENASWWEPEEFAHLKTTNQRWPATWSQNNTSSSSIGDENSFVVHMPEGTFQSSEVAQCPVYVSFAEARAYAACQGGRIMSEPEYKQVVDANQQGESIAGLNSGGWEWTSSLLEPFEGFVADPLYPEYSVDFFDGCHYVLKGASPYTHPSLHRSTFRNFYQPLYPYVFAKFRVVKDC